jgi:hypothetical protein
VLREQEEADFLGNLKVNVAKHAFFNRLLGHAPLTPLVIAT